MRYVIEDTEYRRWKTEDRRSKVGEERNQIKIYYVVFKSTQIILLSTICYIPYKSWCCSVDEI